MMGSTCISRHYDIILRARDIDMSGSIDGSLQHLTRSVIIKDEGIVGIDMEIEDEVAELVMINSSIDLDGVPVYIDEMDIREADGRCIHNDLIMPDGIACIGPRERERCIIRHTIKQHVDHSFSSADNHFSCSVAIDVTQHIGRPMVNEIERHGVGIHIEIPYSGAIEVSHTIEIDHGTSGYW